MVCKIQHVGLSLDFFFSPEYKLYKQVFAGGLAVTKSRLIHLGKTSRSHEGHPTGK